MRAFDCHVHYRTGQRARGGGKWADAMRLFNISDEGTADLAGYYASRDMRAVVFDVDCETTDGERPDNDEIVKLVDASGGTLVGFATVDPWKGQAAIDELDRCRRLGLRGLKVQPVTQRFNLNDRHFYPLWDYCQSAGLPVLVHTGTTGIGAGSPGGAGLKLSYGRPVPNLDDVAADFPNLTLIAAHFGWPWHLELLAIARHKGNVFVDLSGWAPKYIPAEVVQYCNSVIPDKFLFGSDFPLLTPDRWLEQFDALKLKDSVRERVLYENLCRVLDLSPTDTKLTAK